MTVESSGSGALATNSLEKTAAEAPAPTVTPKWSEYFAGGLIDSREADILNSLPKSRDVPHEAYDWSTASSCIVSVLEKQISQEASRSLIVYLHTIVIDQAGSAFAADKDLARRLMKVLGHIVDQQNKASPPTSPHVSSLALEATLAMGRLAKVAPDKVGCALLEQAQKWLKSLKADICIAVAAAVAEAVEPTKGPMRLALALDRGCLEALQSALLRLSNQPQLHYNGILSLWLLSFDPRVSRALLTTCPALIPCSVNISRATAKEKVIRVSVGLWRNLLAAGGSVKDDALALLIGSKALDFAQGAVRKSFPDPDLAGDLHAVAEDLEAAMVKLSSFDEYTSEVKSGNLTWSPPHKSVLFWRDNATRLCDNDCEVLRYFYFAGLTPNLSDCCWRAWTLKTQKC